MSVLAPRQDRNRRTWVVAWLLALVLHALAMIGLQGSHWMAAPPPVATPEPIQLTFVGSPPAKEDPKAPTHFTALPADRKDQAPERAEFLSNVTSRARDRVPGGDQSLPRMSGVADAPSVAIESGQVEPQPASTPAQQDAQKPPGADGKATPEAPKGAGSDVITLPVPDDGHSSHDGSTAPGNSDVPQEEMDNPEGNARLTGDVSLNTTEWDWAPWIQRFGWKLMHRWHAPPAYYMGLLRDGGWTVVEMEISRSGETLRMDKLEEQGHPSLIDAATGALRSMSPLEPLPANFPEKTLILRVRLVYPKVRPR